MLSACLTASMRRTTNHLGGMTMWAFEIRGPGSAAVVERPTPAPGADDLLVQPDAVGVCATDLELLDGSMVYVTTGQTSYPLVPGHEWTGHVVEVGVAVDDFAVGDRVVGEVSIGCSSCGECRGGTYHRCPNRWETGVLGRDGALAEALVVPARSAHHVAASVAVEDAALIEPLAVAYRAVQRLDPETASNILVVGAGTVGTLAALVAARVRRLDVAVSDTRDDRLQRALSLGLTSSDPHVRYPYVIEATGSPNGLRHAHSSLAPGGSMLLLGLTGQGEVPISIDEMVVGDQVWMGSLGSPSVWPEVIKLVERGTLLPSSLVTHRYPLTETMQAFEHVRRASPGTGKVLIVPTRL